MFYITGHVLIIKADIHFQRLSWRLWASHVIVLVGQGYFIYVLGKVDADFSKWATSAILFCVPFNFCSIHNWKVK